MQVGNIHTDKISSTRKKGKVGKAGAFSVSHEEGETKNVKASRVSINSLWQLQALDDWSVDARKMQETGEQLLDDLKDIRMDLLSGELSKENIASLTKSLEKSKIELQFPELQEVVEDIRLRASVELAKLE